MKIKVSPYVAERLLRSKDNFEVETFRAGGKGGQNQNKVNSGVRIRDKITRIAVECREERSQLQNKRTAFARLMERLITHYQAEEALLVQSSIGDKTIRTYKEGKVIDHRTGKTYRLDAILDGELEELIKDLQESQG